MGKQYAILRVQKCKGAEVGAMQYHNDREPGKHTNPDIDQSRTRMNRELCPHADYEGEVQARIDAGYKGTRKVRKDAVRLVEGIVTASPEFFEGASAEEVRDFFEDALGFCREEFGESNLVHFTVHMDEETPHAHFGFVPLRDGKLSWKGFFPDKAALGAMQDRFYGRVGALYGLSRGEKRLEGQPARRHKSVAEYKAESRRVQAELDEKAEQLEAARIVAAAREEAAALLKEAETRRDELVAQVADGERRLLDVRMQVDEETDRLECLRQGARAIERDVAELEPIAADVRRFEGAGRAERGAILDSIAARCAGAARAARAAIKELGDRIWALMRPRKVQPTERSLDDVMRDATEVAKALSRNHVALTNSRTRGQAR